MQLQAHLHMWVFIVTALMQYKDCGYILYLTSFFPPTSQKKKCNHDACQGKQNYIFFW